MYEIVTKTQLTQEPPPQIKKRVATHAWMSPDYVLSAGEKDAIKKVLNGDFIVSIKSPSSMLAAHIGHK